MPVKRFNYGHLLGWGGLAALVVGTAAAAMIAGAAAAVPVAGVSFVAVLAGAIIGQVGRAMQGRVI